jgi:membrane associated rhomboid family serine protease
MLARLAAAAGAGARRAAARAAAPARAVASTAAPRAGPSHLQFPRRGGTPWGGGPISGDAALYGLLAANAAGFAAHALSPTTARRHGIVSAGSLAAGRFHTLAASAFSHKELSHLAVNAFTLFFFGRTVGRAFGGPYLVKLYLAAGVAGAAAHCVATGARCLSVPPHYRDACLAASPGALGASAAVNGIVVLSCLTWPTSQVLVWGVLPVPAALLGAAYVFSDVVGLTRAPQRGGVAHAGHLGGAAVGVAAWALARRRGARWR